MKPIYEKITRIVLAGYTLLLAYWMLIGFGRAAHDIYMYNIRPFYTILYFLRAHGVFSEIWLVNMIGNIGVFVPFGILLPSLFGGRLRKPFSLFLLGIFVLECLQLILKRGSFDVDDLILNSAGFMLGFCIYKLYDRNFKRRM
ncbi:VanZ family protein [Paenibacillus macerans]|uniref:VanZ family protein n=1 Tax=Paenibacillus macerans TaxID=44252 RepID=UPI003D31877E